MQKFLPHLLEGRSPFDAGEEQPRMNLPPLLRRRAIERVAPAVGVAVPHEERRTSCRNRRGDRGEKLLPPVGLRVDRERERQGVEAAVFREERHELRPEALELLPRRQQAGEEPNAPDSRVKQLFQTLRRSGNPPAEAAPDHAGEVGAVQWNPRIAPFQLLLHRQIGGLRTEHGGAEPYRDQCLL